MLPEQQSHWCALQKGSNTLCSLGGEQHTGVHCRGATHCALQGSRGASRATEQWSKVTGVHCRGATQSVEKSVNGAAHRCAAPVEQSHWCAPATVHSNLCKGFLCPLFCFGVVQKIELFNVHFGWGLPLNRHFCSYFVASLRGRGVYSFWRISTQ